MHNIDNSIDFEKKNGRADRNGHYVNTFVEILIQTNNHFSFFITDRD